MTFIIAIVVINHNKSALTVYRKKTYWPSTGPWIGGLQSFWRYSEQDISCHASYHQNENVTVAFTWELVRQSGNVTTIPDGMKPSVEFWANSFTYTSKLNYTLSTDDTKSILRCIALLDDETLGRYEAVDSEPVPSYSTYYDIQTRFLIRVQ